MSGVLPEQEAVEKLKDVIKRQYERKGQDVLDKNFAALDRSMAGTKEIVYPASWADLPDDTAAYLKKDPEDVSAKPFFFSFRFSKTLFTGS